jgi:DNA polymerase-3 subunit delta
MQSRPLHLHGDEPLLVQEAADAIRAAARAPAAPNAQVHTVAGAHFDWSGCWRGAGDEPVRRPAADRDPHPSGKPGKDGSEALQRYCERRPATRARSPWCCCPGWTRPPSTGAWFAALGRRRRHGAIDPVERAALPQWIAQRLARRASACKPGEEGSARWPSSPTGWRATCWPRTRRSEARPAAPGRRAGFEQVEAAVLNVARYDVCQSGITR